MILKRLIEKYDCMVHCNPIVYKSFYKTGINISIAEYCGMVMPFWHYIRQTENKAFWTYIYMNFFFLYFDVPKFNTLLTEKHNVYKYQYVFV